MARMRMSVRFGLAPLVWSALLAALVVPLTARAQSVRGIVTGPSGEVWPGVLVTLLDSAGAVVARDLTGTDGHYLLSAMLPGSFRLRVARIGFRPLTTTPFRLAQDETIAREPLVFSGLRISLDTITVVGRRSCDARAGSQAAALELWEQARTALRVAELTVQRRTVEASLLVFDRRLDPGNGAIRAENSRLQRVVAVRPWASLSIDSLRENGYVVRGPDGSAVYHAPGLDALASDQFVLDHCFRLPGGPDSRTIAVAFEPTRERRQSEIAGIAWLDRDSKALRRIAFRYVNVSQEEERNAGGSLDFLQLPNGAWMISRWEIRMPVLRQEYFVASGRATARMTRMVAHEVRAQGGELTVVARNRDTLWAAPHLFVTGRVVDEPSGRPVEGAIVTISGTTFSARTDTAGGFRIANVPLGDHTLRVSSDSLSLVGASVERRIAGETRGAPLTIQVPSALAVATARCQGVPPNAAATGVVMGRLARADRTASNGEVFLSWNEEPVGAGRRTLRPDGSGVFTACGIPLSEVTIEAVGDSSAAEPVRVRLSDSQPVAILDLVMRRHAGVGALMGTITSALDGRALSDVEVAIRALGLRAYTDAEGRFHFARVLIGEHLVEARRIGFRSASQSVTIAPGVRITRALVLSPVVVLETVEVEATSALPEFEEHRRVGLGKFLTRADFDKAPGVPLTTLLREFPGILMFGGRFAAVASSRQVASLSGVGRKCPEDHERRLFNLECACYATVYLDGQVMYDDPDDPFFDINSIKPEAVEAIEYYAGPASTPAKYSKLNSACGVLVIHTRRYAPAKPQSPN